MGAGKGFAAGAASIGNSVMAGVQLGMQQKRYDQLDERYNKMFDFKTEFERGKQGLPPSFHEEEQADAAAATRPEIPSSVPTSTPGPLGIPRTQFPTGAPIQPLPAADPPKPAGGAMGLLPPTMRMRAPSIGRNPSVGMGSVKRFIR